MMNFERDTRHRYAPMVLLLIGIFLLGYYLGQREVALYEGGDFGYSQQARPLRDSVERLSAERRLLQGALDSLVKHHEHEISTMDSLHIDSVLRFLAEH